MWVFVLDGSQFIIRRCWEHRVDSPDNGRQIWRLIARVKLQDGRLQGKKSSTHLKKKEKKKKSQPCWTPLKLLKSNTTLRKDNITSKLPKAYRRWFWKSAQARNEITHHPQQQQGSNEGSILHTKNNLYLNWEDCSGDRAANERLVMSHEPTRHQI